MKLSTERILTTHVGSLARPKDLLDMMDARLKGEPYDAEAYAARVTSAVAECVRRQVETGIDVVTDGEYGKHSFNFYSNERLAGMERREGVAPPRLASRRDVASFPEYYEEQIKRQGGTPVIECRGPLSYVGEPFVQADIANLRAALEKVDVEEAFIPAMARGSFARGVNRYYGSEEEFQLALAEALRPEYEAIVAAGFVLQIDDPGLAESWDMFVPAISLDEYRKLAMIRVEALNHALRNIPEDRIRYHVCWGSWPGPHVTDIPLRDIVDVMLRVRARAYSVEAANPRHEWEWQVWREVKLPEDKILIPGVIAHTTPVVEHPETVAMRILNFARVVGRERVVAGVDCGFAQSVATARQHPTIVWAKLQSLVAGARLASERLWGA